MTDIILWVAGIVLLVIAILRIRAPYARMTELDRIAQNDARYDSWRGASHLAGADGEKTGADEMREIMRRQVVLWAVVGIVGAVLIFLGFAIK